MKDVLDESIIITLIALQPAKEQITVNYPIESSPMMGKCSSCTGSCKTGCQFKCKTLCKTTCKGGCKDTCKGAGKGKKH
jgi:hypothetical protein